MIVPEHLKIKKDECADDYLIRLFEHKDNYEIDNYTIANLMNKVTGNDYGESKYRKDYSSLKRWMTYFEKKKGSVEPEEVKANYKESIEIMSDGSHKSDKLIKMDEEDTKSPEFLLRAHGYDPSEWELTGARNNIWNSYSKQDGILTLYSSRITVRPNNNQFDIDRLIDRLKDLKPININKTKRNNNKRKGLLEIPIFDAHFGVSTYEDYKETQLKIIEKIRSGQWDEILLIVGQDCLHNDGFTSQTTRGTIIEKVDMEQAWEDASNFYIKIIEESIKNSKNVKIAYSVGNHDEAISWALVKYLKALFPQCEFDDKLEEHKIHVYGNNVIGFTHGDKGGQRARNEAHNVFSALFPEEWGRAENREIHMGHFHTEDAKDKFGTMVRTLATRNKEDEWHKRHSYVGNHKRFMLFEYSLDNLESIYYV